MIFHADTSPKKARVAILISNKVDFRGKTVTRGKDHFKGVSLSIEHNNLNISEPKN